MRRRHSSLLRLGAALLTVLVAGASPGAEAESAPKAADGGAKARPGKPLLPTPEYIQQTFDEGAYEQTIEAVGRVLRLTGKAAKEYDRPALVQLKAEALLRIKSAEPAAKAFGEAADATADPDERDRLRATQLLLKRSPGLTYTPKQRGGGGDRSAAATAIDVVDPEQRKAALAALWADELARLEPVAKRALLERELPPIADAVKDVVAARPLESAATDGDDERTGVMLGDLNKRGLRLIAKRLDRAADRVARIAESADQTSHASYRYGSGRRVNAPFGPQVRRDRVGRPSQEIRQRKGLTPAQKTELQELLETCRAVAEAARDFGKLSDAASAGAKKIIDKAGATAQEVRRVAKAG